MLFAGCAAAEPLPLAEDLADTLVVVYDPENPASGSYTYSYRYPHIDESDPDAILVNAFYADQVETLETNVRFMADGYADAGKTVAVDAGYTVTCNNDDYFSVRMVRTTVSGDRTRVTWLGHTFSRRRGTVDATFSLPHLLGILEAEEQDEYQQSRQTEKASAIVRKLIMDQMEENPEGIPYYSDFTEEDMEYALNPEEDFYLDENGDPVFFIAPGIAADESAGYLVFPIPLEDIEDEL